MDTKNHGFTLAEVLITLGIIGIVAALTLPQMIQNYQKKEMANKLKKFYSTMTQAIKRSEIENAEMKYWYELDDIGSNSVKAQSVAEKYLLPYLNVVKVVPNNKNLVSWQALNGQASGSDLTGNGNGFSSNNYYVLSDGTILRFSAGRGIRVHVDLNGVKRPNTYGKDVFIFTISGFTTSNGSSTRSSYKFIPGSFDQFGSGTFHDFISRDVLLNNNSKSRTCSSINDSWGWACAVLIMKDGWEIKPDYPW